MLEQPPEHGSLELDFRPFVHFASAPPFAALASRRSNCARMSARVGENLGPEHGGAGAGGAALEYIEQPRRLLGREAAPPIADASLAHEVRHPGRPLARPAALIAPHVAETRL